MPSNKADDLMNQEGLLRKLRRGERVSYFLLVLTIILILLALLLL